MNKKTVLFSLLIASIFSTSVVFAQALPTRSDSLSYAIGVNIGQGLKQQGLPVNPQIIANAINDVLQNNSLLMESENCNVYIQSYMQDQFMIKSEENKQKGEAFLAANKAKEGVVTLPDGLQYKIIAAGSGQKPAATSRVKVNYEGKTIDGNIFDSSKQRGTPAEFGINQVIKGWQEILPLMPVGSTWEVYIPSDLAYGVQAPPAIGPNQVLIFEIQLLDIVTP